MTQLKAGGVLIHRNSMIAWISICLLIVWEYCLFRQYVIREITPYYPVDFDQNGYLQSSYILYDAILTHGLKTALLNLNLSPQTLIFPIQAAFAYFLFGASRLTALSLNFFYFAALQLAVFYTLKRVTKRYLFGYLGIGILLSTHSFFFSGGAYDFRIDFMAQCLYGIWVCSIICSGIFQSRKWLWLAISIALLLTAMRFITSAYILSIITIYLIYLLGLNFLKKGSAANTRRLKNVALFLFLFLMLMSPLIWLHRDLILNYYIVGHYASTEKLMRAKEAGVIDHWTNLRYYPTVFIKQHLGKNTIIELSIAIIVLLMAHFLSSNTRTSPLKHPIQIDAELFIYLFICIFVPILILTVDQSKSVIVSGIVLVPFCLFFTYGMAMIYQSTYPNYKTNLLLIAFTMYFLINGLNSYFSNSATRSHLNEQQMATVTTMIDDIGNYIEKAGRPSVIVSADQIADYLIYPIEPLYFERHGVLLDIKPGLGATELNSETKTSAFKKIENSQVIILADVPYSPNLIYPFETSIAPYRMQFKKFSEKKFSLLGEYVIHQVRYKVFTQTAKK